MKLLDNKTAVITGCRRGIGQATLERFAQNGAGVFACVRAVTDDFRARCEQLARENGVFIRPVGFDLASEEEIGRGIREIGAEKMSIDVLVNNAGIVPPKRLFQMTPVGEMEDVFAVNFFAAMRITQSISRMMARRKCGSIVNVSSIAALDGDPGQVEYAASKAAILGATRKLALELGASGIRVNAVAPGLTETDMLQGMEAGLQQRILERTVLKRAAQPQEIADVILFLASDLSSYLTGQILRVDGGM